MAVAIVSITDSLGTDFTAGGCIEEVEGDVSITISTTATLDTSSIENFGGYVDGSLTDNGDGTWTFDVDKNSLEGDPCLLIKEYTPQDCALVCPTITLTQQVDGVTYSTNFSLESEYSFSDIVINAVTHAGTSGTVIGAVAGDCITYALVLTLLGENGSSCVYSYDLTLPACNTEVVNSDCTTTNYCTVNTPSLAYVCDSGGTITVTATPGNEVGVAVVSEWLSWSNDGLNYTTFTDSFITSESTGYIKYEIDYEDGCDLQELIIPFVCTVDCDGTFDYNCTYLSGTNQFVATFTDNNTVPIQTDVIEYFIDGSLVGIPYVSGTLIDGTGINRIDWQRTIVFDAPCPDVVIDFSCAKVDENCDYVGFDLSAVYDSATDSVIPTFTGDESVLDVSDKTYSVDGYTYSIYLGGAIPTNLFATFVWRIQKVGCEPMCLVATAARSGVDFNITNDINNPISIDISNTNPIDINITNNNENPISVIGNFCCETPTNDSGACPDGTTCAANLAATAGGFITWDPCVEFYSLVLQYNNGGIWEFAASESGYQAPNLGVYRLVGTKVSCADIVIDSISTEECPDPLNCTPALTNNLSTGAITWTDCLDYDVMVLQYNRGGTWDTVATQSPYTAKDIGEYRLIASKVGCLDVVIDTLIACSLSVSEVNEVGGSGLEVNTTIEADKTIQFRFIANSNRLTRADRFKLLIDDVLVLDTGYYYSLYDTPNCPETNGLPAIDVSGVADGDDVGGLLPVNTLSLVVNKAVGNGTISGIIQCDIPLTSGQNIKIIHNDPECTSQLGWGVTMKCV